MATTDGTLQLTSNLDPTAASSGKGRLYWNDSTKTFFQIDNQGLRTELIQVNSLQTNHTTGSTDTAYTITTVTSVFANTIDNNQVITLPPASSVRTHNIKKIAQANTMSITPAGSDTIDGASVKDVFDKFESITVQSDGSTNWYII